MMKRMRRKCGELNVSNMEAFHADIEFDTDF